LGSLQSEGELLGLLEASLGLEHFWLFDFLVVPAPAVEEQVSLLSPAVDLVFGDKSDFIVVKFDPVCFISLLVGLHLANAEIVAARRPVAMVDDHAVQVVLVLLELLVGMLFALLIFVGLARVFVCKFALPTVLK
jgi:hypothetical protein